MTVSNSALPHQIGASALTHGGLPNDVVCGVDHGFEHLGGGEDSVGFRFGGQRNRKRETTCSRMVLLDHSLPV